MRVRATPLQTLPVPADLWEQARVKAAEYGLKRTEFVRQCIEAGVAGAVAIRPAEQPGREPAAKPHVPEKAVPAVTAPSGEYPAGFDIDFKGNGRWRYRGWYFSFPAERRPQWKDALAFVEHQGPPSDENAESWESFGDTVWPWLKPVKL